MDEYHEDDPLRYVPAIKRLEKISRNHHVPYISASVDELESQLRSQNDDEVPNVSVVTEVTEFDVALPNKNNIVLFHRNDILL